MSEVFNYILLTGESTANSDNNVILRLHVGLWRICSQFFKIRDILEVFFNRKSEDSHLMCKSSYYLCLCLHSKQQKF